MIGAGVGSGVHARLRDAWGPQLLVDGDMEAVGVASWPVAGGTVAKRTDDPHSGSQYLRISGAYAYVTQTIWTPGTRYLTTGWIRGDGTNAPELWDISAGRVWLGVKEAVWQYVYVDFVAVGVGPAIITPAGYVDADDFISRARR